MPSDLLLLNARVITLDPARPAAEAVAVRGGRVLLAGVNDACRRAASGTARVIDCAGMTVTPGFTDAHIHLAAYAAALRAVDCSGVRSIDAIVQRIRERARATPPGEWIRASGYDEWALDEGRHPTRWELDAAAPEHPVRLIHRSGHALVLNSRALALAGITIASEEPPGGVIERRLPDGEPTGVLLDMNDAVASAVPPLPHAELAAGLRAAGERLLMGGVTAVQDMSPTNGPEAADFLDALAAESGFAPRLLPPAEGWPGDANRLARRPGRPVKVMLRETGERPVPDTAELAGIIQACAGRGRAVAVHAVERRSVVVAVDAFEQVVAVGGTAVRHRIEHAGVCPPDLAGRIARLELLVVSNPAFLYYSGDRYRQRVDEADLPYLYDTGGLHAAGIRLAAGSDAPVAPPEPLCGLRAAASRRTVTGAVLPGTLLSPDAALALFTSGAACAAGAESEQGRIAPGMRADFAVLSGAPAAERTHVEMTIIAGKLRWTRGLV